jgi:hypothetical protein
MERYFLNNPLENKIRCPSKFNAAVGNDQFLLTEVSTNATPINHRIGLYSNVLGTSNSRGDR